MKFEGAPVGMRIKRKDLLEAKDLDWNDIIEPWINYVLEDGSTLKIRHVLKQIKRLERKTRDGDPIYLIDSTTILRWTQK